VDVAEATAKVSANAIRNAAGTATLAQANQLGQWALSAPTGFTAFDASAELRIEDVQNRLYPTLIVRGATAVSTALGGVTATGLIHRLPSANVELTVTAGGVAASGIWVNLEEVNAGVMQLSKAKAKVGQNKKCSIATAFYDALVQGGLGKGTAANYLSTFRDAVKTGKPVTDWNPKRKPAGSSPKSAKGKKEFADKLATVFRDGEFEGFINDLEASFQDDEIETLIEGVKSFLEASGVKLD
jgi:hypothetical protein